MQTGGRHTTSTCVNCLGLPFRATVDQIREFFAPFKVAEYGINILNGPDGRPSGQAIVRFETAEEAQNALKYDRRTFIGASRYVEVFSISEDKALQKIAMDRPPDLSHGILKLRGLPFAAGVVDVMNFFSAYNIAESMITMGMDAQGRPSGECWVQFPSQKTAESAMETMNGAMIGTRYIELYASNPSEVGTVSLKSNFVGGSGGKPKGKGKGGGKDKFGEPALSPDQVQAMVASMSTPGGFSPEVQALADAQAMGMASASGMDMAMAELYVGAGGYSGYDRFVDKSFRPHKMCEMWAMGHCKRGDDCTFAHDPSELKQNQPGAKQEDERELNEHERLVRDVKQLQKQSEEGKLQWWAWVSQYGANGTRDPAAYDEAFLGSFLEAATGGTIHESVSQKAITSMEELVAQDPRKAELVQAVKMSQRNSLEFKEGWARYCKNYGGGNRDPMNHTAEFMQHFMDSFNQGIEPTDPNPYGKAPSGGCGGCGGKGCPSKGPYGRPMPRITDGKGPMGSSSSGFGGFGDDFGSWGGGGGFSGGGKGKSFGKGNNQSPLPGDWFCPGCSDLQFAKNQHCRKCGMPNPNHSGDNQNLLPGDWFCPGCGDLNFAKNTVCRKCATPNPNLEGGWQY